MLYSKKVLVKVFEGETKEQAYLAGCKGIANYVAKPRYENISYKVHIKKQDGKYIAQFTLFVSLDISEDQQSYCKICREKSRTFWGMESDKCPKCDMKYFCKRINEKLTIAYKSYKRLLR